MTLNNPYPQFHGGVKLGVLCHSSSVLLCTCGALESKSHQQLDRCMAATVWAARHHSNSPIHYSLSPLAAWKPHQCTSAWRHWLKPKRKNMFIRNQRGMSMSWNGIWLKYGQQPAEFMISRISDETVLVRVLKPTVNTLLWCVSLWYVVLSWLLKLTLLLLIQELSYRKQIARQLRT